MSEWLKSLPDEEREAVERLYTTRRRDLEYLETMAASRSEAGHHRAAAACLREAVNWRQQWRVPDERVIGLLRRERLLAERPEERPEPGKPFANGSLQDHPIG